MCLHDLELVMFVKDINILLGCVWIRKEEPVSYCPVNDYPQHPINIQESKLVTLVNHNIQLHFVKIKK